MRTLQKGRVQPSLLNGPVFPDKGGLLKAGIFSLLLHITLVAALILGLRPTITKMHSSVYRVTIRPFSPQGNGSPFGSAIPGPPVGPPNCPLLRRVKN